MNVDEIVEACRLSPECHVMPPAGRPNLAKPSHVLPSDLRRFYEICGGIELFVGREFSFSILKPDQVIQSNPVLLGDYYKLHKNDIDQDISESWYMVARGISLPLEVISIDFGGRLGCCYDSFWDVYATGNSKIVAVSFSDFLERLWTVRGSDLYWARGDFNLGFSYGSGSDKDFGVRF